MKSLSLIAACATLAAASPAFAATTINFDTLPGGAVVGDKTPITNQYSSLGVTFSALASSGAVVAPVATNYAGGPTGPNYSGNFLANAPDASPFWFNPGFELTPRYDLIRILFAGGANNVSLSLNNFSNVSNTTFNAYDAGGALLQTFVFQANEGWARVNLSASGIARLDLVTSQYQQMNTIFGIDQLTFDPAATPGGVPEPTTWAMMIVGFGMIGAGARNRRRTTRVTYSA